MNKKEIQNFMINLIDMVDTLAGAKEFFRCRHREIEKTGADLQNEGRINTLNNCNSVTKQ